MPYRLHAYQWLLIFTTAIPLLLMALWLALSWVQSLMRLLGCESRLQLPNHMMQRLLTLCVMGMLSTLPPALLVASALMPSFWNYAANPIGLLLFALTGLGLPFYLWLHPRHPKAMGTSALHKSVLMRHRSLLITLVGSVLVFLALRIFQAIIQTDPSGTFTFFHVSTIRLWLSVLGLGLMVLMGLSMAASRLSLGQKTLYWGGGLFGLFLCLVALLTPLSTRFADISHWVSDIAPIWSLLQLAGLLIWIALIVIRQWMPSRWLQVSLIPLTLLNAGALICAATAFSWQYLSPMDPVMITRPRTRLILWLTLFFVALGYLLFTLITAYWMRGFWRDARRMSIGLEPFYVEVPLLEAKDIAPTKNKADDSASSQQSFP